MAVTWKAATRRQWQCWWQGEGEFSRGGLEEVVVVMVAAVRKMWAAVVILCRIEVYYISNQGPLRP